ncbi:hypothetical protein [Epilithonimonas sp.]|uniref:hypothetical protein n=1 Tax=Epilithonimonas sp. TaxID=2894511 RepID=UPI002FDDE770
MKIWICTVFIFSFNIIYSQKLDENKDIDTFLKSVVSEDDIYDNEINSRIQYINNLDKRVLINYTQIPNDLIQKLNKKELDLLDKIYQMYFSEVRKMESDFYIEQKVKYKSLTPKSRISKILLIDEIKNFPDTYSIISTNTLLNIKNKNINDDLKSVFEIYRKNSNLLSQLVVDVDNYRKQFVNNPMYYTNWENVEKIDFYNKINAVLWSYSNSKVYFDKINH